MKVRWLFGVCLLIGLSATSWGLMIYGTGNGPIRPANALAWPKLTEAVNDESRVSHMWCNGYEDFCFKGDAVAVNRGLEKFAQIEARQLQVVIRPARQKLKSKDAEAVPTVSWSIHVFGFGRTPKPETRLIPEGAFSDSLPTLKISVGGETDLNSLRIPASVRVYQLEDLQEAYEDQFMLERGDVRAVSRVRSQLQSLDGDQSRTGLSEEEYQAQIERIGAFVNALSKPQE